MGAFTANPNNAELFMAQSEPGPGYPVSVPLGNPLSDFYTLGSGVPVRMLVTAASNNLACNLVTNSTAENCLTWQGTATTTNIAYVNHVLRSNFCENNKVHLKVKVLARKYGSGTDPTTLKINLAVNSAVNLTGTADAVIHAGIASAALAAKQTAGTGGFEEITFDVGATLTDTTKAYLKRGANLQFTFAPSVAINANMVLEVIPVEIQICNHISYAKGIERKGVVAM